VRGPLAAGLVGALVATVAGCGGDGGGNGADEPAMPAPAGVEFPAPKGRTLSELRRGLGGGPVMAPAVSLLEPGRQRLAFGLFDRGRRQFAQARAAVYVAHGPRGPATGPFEARYESLETDPEFRSRGVTDDPDSASSVYTATVPFERPGQHRVMTIASLDDRLLASEPAPLPVVRDGRVPEVGERAPRIETDTVESAGGDVGSIDTRVPPGSMHEVSFADVLGRRPAILLFATPALCQSRVCGPVVDVAEQVKARHRGDAAFIHQEIYRDNEIENGFRPQVTAYRLPTEPWLFAVDRRGRIAARIEGAFSERELADAVAKAERR
jgi:hypothetical protein